MVIQERQPKNVTGLIQSYDRRDFESGPKTYSDERLFDLIDNATGLNNIKNQEFSVADMMSGPGNVGLALHKRHPEHTYYFIDLANKQLQKISDEKVKGIKIQGDVRKLPIENNTFNVSVARYAIKDLIKEEQPAALAEIFRTIKPGGVFVLTDMVSPDDESKQWLNVQHAKKQELSGRRESEGVCHIPTEVEWLQVLSQVGFISVVEGRYTSHVSTNDWVKGKQITQDQAYILNEMIVNAPPHIQKIFHIQKDEEDVKIEYPVVVIKATKPI